MQVWFEAAGVHAPVQRRSSTNMDSVVVSLLFSEECM